MGAGASAGVEKALKDASDEDLKKTLSEMSSEDRKKVESALTNVTAASPASPDAAPAAGPASPDAAPAASPAADKPKPHCTLVFSRHGESEWNVANKFTGWVDVDLSEKGTGEAKGAGDLIKEAKVKIDSCHTSVLTRAIKTCNYALENSDQLHVPVNKTWRLNERMYGGLTGLDKKETVVKHGAEQVQTWRRSFDLPPPDIEEDSEYNPIKDPRYADVPKEEIPKTESLKEVIKRVMPYWEGTIQPELKAGKCVFVAAHGNSIRAIVKYIEDIPDDVIPGLEIPTGTPLVYELDADLKPIPTELAIEPLKFGRYLGDVEKIKAAAEAVKNQTKV